MSIDYSNFKFPKNINDKKTKKKVSKTTYQQVEEDCDYRCVICGSKVNLQLHHIYYRSEEPSEIDNAENCVMLCHQDFSTNKCHKKVHNNKKYWQPKLIEIRKNLNK